MIVAWERKKNRLETEIFLVIRDYLDKLVKLFRLTGRLSSEQ